MHMFFDFICINLIVCADMLYVGVQILVKVLEKYLFRSLYTTQRTPRVSFLHLSWHSRVAVRVRDSSRTCGACRRSRMTPYGIRGTRKD